MRTGSLSLDLLFGGGYRKGNIYEYHGPTGSGKTALCLMGAAVQSNPVLFFCTEPLSIQRLKEFGVDVHSSLYTSTPYAEIVYDIIQRLPNREFFFVLDSTSMLVSLSENRSLYDGMNAVSWCTHHVVSALRRFCVRTGSIAVMTTQIRARFGSGGTTAFRILSSLCDYRVKLSRTEAGRILHAKTVCDAYNTPGQFTTLPFSPPGVDTKMELLLLAEAFGIVSARGSWYYFLDTRLGQGRAEASENLDREYRQKIETLLLGELQ